MGSFLNVTVQLLYWQLLTCVTAYILIEGAHNVWSIEAAVCGPIEVNCLTLTGISTMLSIPFISVILETLVKQEDLTAAQKGPKVESTPYNICVYECWCLLSCICVRDAAGKRGPISIRYMCDQVIALTPVLTPKISIHVDSKYLKWSWLLVVLINQF